MAGIYIHIPFCKQACHYCNFHFSISSQTLDPFLEALHKEIKRTQSYLSGETIETIYFGGGTPSLLSTDQIQKIIDQLSRVYEFAPQPEITLEANPDDLTRSKVQAYRSTPINRYSIGIQSFFDRDLQWMNRAHSSQEGDAAIKRVQDAGVENITIDLIYGTPGMNDTDWQANLQKAFALQVPHLSSYCLTVEPKTALDHMVKEGQKRAVDDAQAQGQFETLVELTAAAGFEHYEISNFAKEGYISRHNSSYWLGKKYLGLGPSAHSFDGEHRRWNVANNVQYIKAINEGRDCFEEEQLNPADRFNEYLMTGLRTKWGVDLPTIEQRFGSDYATYLKQEIAPMLDSGQLLQTKQTIHLSPAAKFIADTVISELFWVGE